MIYAVDRILPGPRVGGRDSQEAYAEWEYGIGRALLKEYADWFGALEGKRVLDIGCGLGGKSVAYAEAGAKVTGVDLNQTHAAGALDYAIKRVAPIEVVTGDAADLPFLEGSFDLVVANDSMEHFSKPASALGECARVVRAGGLVFLFFTPWGSPLASHLYDHIHTPWCHLLYSDRMLEQLLELSLRRLGDQDPAGEAVRMTEEYRDSNNRIDVASYRRILAGVPSLETVFEELKPPRFRFLAPLTSIPRLGELFTGTVTAFLRKKG
jgi:ubiquinone/menaquinone biosynthesis C-methylase UbiE